jgi:superfamily I DNA/RNA helicase
MLKRQNPGERDAIVERVARWLDWTAVDKGTLAVLSPYVNQVKMLQNALWKRFAGRLDSVDVLTVHKAQGREWDTVFFSASDTGRLPDNSPFLSDTAGRNGSLVVNTAISRAKRHLRIFCDREFWALRQTPETLLSEVSLKSNSPKP